MTARAHAAEEPVVDVTRRRRLSAAWIAPIVAAIAVGYLVYDGIRHRGPTVSITFKNAEGIVVGKSAVKYEGVQIGTVRGIVVDPAAGTVTVTARLDASGRPVATQGAQFWIQNPEIGLQGIGDLDTLISGPYIACRPGRGPSQTAFVGLDIRPATPEHTPGLRLTLTADQVGSLHPGSPVIYRGVTVGAVDRVSVAGPDDPIQIDIFIEDAHRTLVRPETYFFERSGLHASFDLESGFRFDTSSFQSILNGGIGFHTPPGGAEEATVADGATYPLHQHPNIDTHDALPITISFPNGEGVIPEKTEIRYDGVTIGLVTALDFLETFDGVRVSALLYPAGQRIAVEGATFWIVRPEIGIGGVRNIDTLVDGVYIDCRPGSGAPSAHFAGLAARPGGNPTGPGLNVVLRASAAGSLRPGAPVYYREVVVGEILSVNLAEDASSVLIGAHIEPRYAPLVHEHTVFWNASGVKISGGLGGISVKTESLESLLAGGVAFATPTQSRMGRSVSDGAVFELHASVQSQWLDWAPSIRLAPAQ